LIFIFLLFFYILAQPFLKVVFYIFIFIFIFILAQPFLKVVFYIFIWITLKGL